MHMLEQLRIETCMVYYQRHLVCVESFKKQYNDWSICYAIPISYTYAITFNFVPFKVHFVVNGNYNSSMGLTNLRIRWHY